MTSTFEKVTSLETPADIIYEDDRVIVFLEAVPIHKGHARVVPKKECSNSSETVFSHMMLIGAQIGRRQEERLGATGVNFIFDNDTASSDEALSAFLHVVPRYDTDLTETFYNEIATPEEQTLVAKTLR